MTGSRLAITQRIEQLESALAAERARSQGLDLSDEEMRALLTTGSSAAWQSATAKLREALRRGDDG